MIVLGMDTATSSTAVALRLADGTVLERRDDPPAGAHPGHATRLLAMAGELLAESGEDWSQLERIAVGTGPGTFTGLRVGIATARGLAQSLAVPLTPVSSLKALVHRALADTAIARCDGLLAVIDARRGEVFAAAYDRAGCQLSLPRALKPQELDSVLAEAARKRGQKAWLGFGDGALRYGEQLEPFGIGIPAEQSPLHLVSAATVCELAAGAGGSSASYQEVLPDYLRRPDAELTLERARGEG